MARIAHTFDGDAEGGARGDAGRADAVARLRVLVGGGVAGSVGGGAVGVDGAGDGADDVPVLAALRALVPGGALRRGGVLALADRVQPGPGPGTNAGASASPAGAVAGAGDAPGYLALALTAGATAGGAWCGVVGLPGFGIAAASGMGADLGRFLMVDEPGERWAEAVTVLAGAVDLVLVRPPRRPGGEQVRRIGARIRRTVRQRGAVLVVAGEWPGADLRLRLTEAVWCGLGEGSGHLTGRRVTVVADGRGAAGRERTARLWLPAADGAVREWRVETDAPGADADAVADAAQQAEVAAEVRDAGDVVRLWSA